MFTHAPKRLDRRILFCRGSRMGDPRKSSLVHVLFTTPQTTFDVSPQTRDFPF